MIASCIIIWDEETRSIHYLGSGPLGRDTDTLISYLRDPSRGAERHIRRLAFKYVLIDDELYRRTAEDLLLKCLDSD